MENEQKTIRRIQIDSNGVDHVVEAKALPGGMWELNYNHWNEIYHTTEKKIHELTGAIAREDFFQIENIKDWIK